MLVSPNWKKNTPRDKRFLLWLLTLPCELRHKGLGPCMGDMIYHHTSTGGMSCKGSDYEAVSSCFGHHTVFDNASKRGVGIFTEDELQGIIERNKREWVAMGNKINE